MATQFTFAVTYRNREGSAPESVVVEIGGTAHAMTGDGTGWKSGARFTYTTKLPIGVHAVTFRATSRDKFSVELDGGSITVTNPPPPPTPKPTAPPSAKPTPTPTAKPTPTPKSTADPTPTSPPATTTPTATPPSGATDGATPTAPMPDPTAGSSAGSGGGPVTTPTPPGAGTVDAGPRGGHPFAGEREQGGWGELTRYLMAFDRGGLSTFRLLPVMVTTTGAVAMAMAFGFFGKRRRDGEPPAPDEVLANDAARATPPPPTNELVPTVATVPAPVDPDSLMPRWRRPSLLEARKADPLRSTGEIQRLSFDHGLVGAMDGYERRMIRYHVVQLLDAPDELRAAEIGALTNGDEVQLLERSGAYWRVLCPDGRQGWIHKMTLGDVVGQPATPTAQEMWATATVEEDEVDPDVLAAFIAARGR